MVDALKSDRGASEGNYENVFPKDSSFNIHSPSLYSEKIRPEDVYNKSSSLPRRGFTTTHRCNERIPAATERQRAATIAPSLPPKQRPIHRTNSPLGKTLSSDAAAQKYSIEPSTNTYKESIYISPDDIETFPERRPAAERNIAPLGRPAPPIPGIRLAQRRPNPQRQTLGVANTGRRPPASPTNFLKGNQLDISAATYHEQQQFRPISPSARHDSVSPTSPIPEAFVTRTINFNEQDARYSGSPIFFIPSGDRGLSQENLNVQENPMRSVDLLMKFNKLQSNIMKLYKAIEATHPNSSSINNLKARFQLSEHDSSQTLMQRIHSSLAPPVQTCSPEPDNLFIVDFRAFRDKFDLRQHIIQMFARPGPPSISYSKVDAKMDSIIMELCARVESMRNSMNELVESPAHARNILHGVADAECLVKALRENQLWIRWGTVTNLPPLSHLYMHKHPPSYEVRKAVTISHIAERKRAMSDMFRSVLDPKTLCPPIYGKLKCDSISNQTKWQVSKYNEETGKFESHKCKLPSWIDEDSTARSLLNSSNRTTFDDGEHPYALYCVYLIVIKDFTLAREESKRNEKESSWAVASKYQYYIGSSSTGVLYRFALVENSHCDRTWRVLTEATTLEHFRCYEGCDLVEACLALSWARRQPRAVFVLNSFLPSNMSSLTLEQKEPFKERMLALEHHLTDGKKIGPLCDMRYGMNGTTTIREDEE